MKWEVEYTDKFGAWWESLTEAEQDSIDASVGLLEQLGPQLGFRIVPKSKARHMGNCVNSVFSIKASRTGYFTPLIRAGQLYC